MSPNRKLEEWIAAALSDIAPADNVNLEKASTSDEISSIRRVIVDGTDFGNAPGSLPQDGDKRATVRVSFITAVDRVSAEAHDDFATLIQNLLEDPANLAESADTVSNFLLYFCNEVTVTPSATGETNGTLIRQTDFVLSDVLFRADNGDGT